MPGGFDSPRPGRKSRRGLAKFKVVAGGFRCSICRKVRNTLQSLQRHDKQKHQGRTTL